MVNKNSEGGIEEGSKKNGSNKQQRALKEINIEFKNFPQLFCGD